MPPRPLRRVVTHYRDPYGIWIEVLECGHEQRQRQDIYGPTNAFRRRCRRCASAHVAEVPGTAPPA